MAPNEVLDNLTAYTMGNLWEAIREISGGTDDGPVRTRPCSYGRDPGSVAGVPRCRCSGCNHQHAAGRAQARLAPRAGVVAVRPRIRAVVAVGLAMPAAGVARAQEVMSPAE
jgi:hypothetical protein